MQLTTPQAYEAAFARLDAMISEGFEGVSDREQEFRQLAEAIQAYEQARCHFPNPTTLIGMIELKMAESRLQRDELATLLGLKPGQLGDLLAGKQELTPPLARQLYKKLGIPAEFLLEAA